jgi:hypothetical protein
MKDFTKLAKDYLEKLIDLLEQDEDTESADEILENLKIMEKKINIAELLKDCPKGMEFDCSIHTRPVIFNCVKMESDYPIKISSKDGFSHSLTYWGSIYNCEGAKCVIFPKGKKTWEGFVPHCQFKDGDILVHTQNEIYNNQR